MPAILHTAAKYNVLSYYNVIQTILAIISAALFCTVKFAIAFPIAIHTLDLNFAESLLFGFASGSLGNLAFIYAGDLINNLIDKLIRKIRGKRPPKPKKIFTKRVRRFVKIKNRFGLPGLALLTPVVISIPIGNFLATRFFHNKKVILLYMEAAVLVWTLIISALNTLV